MKTHTPGPWSIDDKWPFRDEQNRQFPAVFKHTERGDLLIASFEHAAVREHNDANARLIAAAPELLDALKALYTETADYIVVNHLGDIHQNQSMRLAKSALEKAGVL